MGFAKHGNWNKELCPRLRGDFGGACHRCTLYDGHLARHGRLFSSGNRPSVSIAYAIVWFSMEERSALVADHLGFRPLMKILFHHRDQLECGVALGVNNYGIPIPRSNTWGQCINAWLAAKLRLSKLGAWALGPLNIFVSPIKIGRRKQTDCARQPTFNY